MTLYLSAMGIGFVIGFIGGLGSSPIGYGLIVAGLAGVAVSSYAFPQ